MTFRHPVFCCGERGILSAGIGFLNSLIISLLTFKILQNRHHFVPFLSRFCPEQAEYLSITEPDLTIVYLKDSVDF